MTRKSARKKATLVVNENFPMYKASLDESIKKTKMALDHLHGEAGQQIRLGDTTSTDYGQLLKDTSRGFQVKLPTDCDPLIAKLALANQVFYTYQQNRLTREQLSDTEKIQFEQKLKTVLSGVPVEGLQTPPEGEESFKVGDKGYIDMSVFSRLTESERKVAAEILFRALCTDETQYQVLCSQGQHSIQGIRDFAEGKVKQRTFIDEEGNERAVHDYVPAGVNLSDVSDKTRYQFPRNFPGDFICTINFTPEGAVQVLSEMDYIHEPSSIDEDEAAGLLVGVSMRERYATVMSVLNIAPDPQIGETYDASAGIEEYSAVLLHDTSQFELCPPVGQSFPVQTASWMNYFNRGLIPFSKGAAAEAHAASVYTAYKNALYELPLGKVCMTPLRKPLIVQEGEVTGLKIKLKAVDPSYSVVELPAPSFFQPPQPAPAQSAERKRPVLMLADAASRADPEGLADASPAPDPRPEDGLTSTATSRAGKSTG